MKIVFTGLPHFGKKLVAELKEFDKKNSYVFCDTYYSKLDRIKFIFHLLNADKVVSINGVSLKSGSLDWVIKKKKNLILQWQGSDVSTAIENAKGRALNRKYIDYAKNYTDAEWLKNELKELNISADILHFKHLVVPTNNSPFKTNDVVSYLADGKEKFYGIDAIINLANDFPQIRFHLIGTKGEGMEVPENVIFYGWVSVEKVKALMNEHPIFMRLPGHDGYSLSVLEAIANGNYVIWNYPHPHVLYLSNKNELKTKFSELIERINMNGKSRQMEGVAWATSNLDRSTVLSKYIETITSL